jgi:hypothetical protein
MFQLYQDENNLFFDGMTMMSVLVCCFHQVSSTNKADLHDTTYMPTLPIYAVVYQIFKSSTAYRF